MPPRPSIDETLLAVTATMAQRSTCPRSHVGAVIARDGRILSSGYNGSPAGTPHCDHPPECEGCVPGVPAGTPARLLPKGTMLHRDGTWHLPDCTKVTGCLTAIHAEANAIAYAARNGVALEGSTLYTSLTPCRACAQLIVQAGIREVLASEEYRDQAGSLLLGRSGVRVRVML
jgi:dCMP deaminase